MLNSGIESHRTIDRSDPRVKGQRSAMMMEDDAELRG